MSCSFRVGQKDPRGQIVVVIEEHMGLHSALGTTELRPWEQGQAERDCGGVEGEAICFLNRNCLFSLRCHPDRETEPEP